MITKTPKEIIEEVNKLNLPDWFEKIEIKENYFDDWNEAHYLSNVNHILFRRINEKVGICFCLTEMQRYYNDDTYNIPSAYIDIINAIYFHEEFPNPDINNDKFELTTEQLSIFARWQHWLDLNTNRLSCKEILNKILNKETE